MNATQHKIFESYFQAQVEKAGAGTPSEMLRLLDRLEQDAREKGIVPISARETISVPVHSPQVQAILAGKEISLGGIELNAHQSLEGRLASNTPKQSLMLIGLIVVITIIFLGILLFSATRPEAEPAATATETPTLTTTPTETARPVSGAATPTPYALVMATAKVPTGINDPVSVEFGGVTFVLYVSSIQGGEWQPSVAEWLEGTVLRRVLAVPYSQEVGNAVVGMKYGDPIYLRLNSGEVVTYQIVEIARVKRHQIEILTDAHPGIAIVLYGERSADRYVLIGDAVQLGSEATRTPTPSQTPTKTATPTVTATFDLSTTPTIESSLELSATTTITPTVTLVSSVTQTATITPTWTPTATPPPTATRTPTVTITPAFAFIPPPLVSVVVTEAQSITNDLAGLRLDVSNCTRVAQIGSREGRFLLCDVTLTAIRPGAEYSGQALAITEYGQVSNKSDWWPPAMAIVGGIGDGSLAGEGSSITGKVAGEVRKSQSDPVLLWEQAGIRFVIYLETE